MSDQVMNSSKEISVQDAAAEIHVWLQRYGTG